MWQPISTRHHMARTWPERDQPLIDLYRQRVEDGEYRMAQKRDGDNLHLVVQKRAVKVEPRPYWSEPEMPDLKSERQTEGNERRWRRGKTQA